MILNKLWIYFKKKTKSIILKFKYIKTFSKNDLFIYDDIFPHPISGFRYEEFKILLNTFTKSKIFINPKAYPALKTEIRFHKVHLSQFIEQNPRLIGKFIKTTKFININSKLFYCVFINNIYDSIYWLEKFKIPFVFTLYPGGGFHINDENSDLKLKKVFSSPQFRKVIVTQLFTKEYLIQKKYCTPDKIEYIFGCVVPQKSLNKIIEVKEYYPKKQTFDIIFCAAKYMPKGLDKGYDLFIELANSLVEKYDFIRFHVVGGFDKEDIEVNQLENKIQFYGYQKFDDLSNIYLKMDVIISPNRPFVFDKGAFDGFPLGTVIEAVLNGVVAIVTDGLNQNTVFENQKDIIIVDDNLSLIENEIVNLVENPEILKIIAKNGKEKFLKIYSNDYQMKSRIEILKKEIESYK